MANSGINKVQVKKARDALIARGANPSIDAVRIELGNTGSKGTIHKYLSELAQESDASLGKRAALSETLGHIVVNLANQLQEEAQAIVKESSQAHHVELKRVNDRLAEQARLLTVAAEDKQKLSNALEEADRLKMLSTRAEQELRSKAERLAQQVESQVDIIKQKDAHISSLEEKHLHAREALEHYRNSVKDQREQDQRRNEHQVQQLQVEIRQLNQTISLKRTDITQLNKDNARLATEISEVRKQLRTSEQYQQSLAAQVKTYEETLSNVNAKLNESTRQLRADAVEIALLKEQLIALQSASQSMQGELIALRTELAVKNEMFETFQRKA